MNTETQTLVMVTGTYAVQDTWEFLERLGRNGGYQYFCEFKLEDEREEGKPNLKNMRWFQVGEHKKLPAHWNQVYFPVFPITEELPYPRRGKIHEIAVMNCMFGEFDMKDGWETLEQILDSVSLKPSAVVFSGHGWHCYWFLRDTIYLTKENRQEMKELLYGWIDKVGSDSGAKDLARVLRVPLSFNNKYDDHIQVQIVYVDYNIEYSIEEIRQIVGKIEKKHEDAMPISSRKAQGLVISADPSLYAKVVEALAALKPERADEYHKWMEVGFALYSGFEGSTTGLQLWDMWSQKSVEYKNGDCAAKWKSMPTERDDKVTLKRLFERAEEDGKGTFIKLGDKNSKPSDYMEAVHTMGYYFTQNIMNDRIYVNGVLMSDGLESLMMTKLRENNYQKKGTFQDAFIAEGQEHQFHPIRDYLLGLKWDGVDHLGRLGTYVKDKDSMFPTLIRKWFIGAVSKNLAPSAKEQNPMLVLAGAQGKGKSVLTQWIGSPLPEFYIASPIYPDNKDFIINSASHFVWEVEELGSTIRKADIEALKAYISRTIASFRAPYGHFEIQKSVTASYIGTINPDGNGFLNDSTGNRRYRVCHITKIDWNYEKDIDINQVWAQAVALFQAGETYLLDEAQEAKIQEINGRYDLDDPLTPHIMRQFEIDDEHPEWFVPTHEIIFSLKTDEIIQSQVDKSISMRIGNIMTRLGAEKETKRIDGKQVRGWANVRSTSRIELKHPNRSKGVLR